jgi:hypothetical protein
MRKIRSSGSVEGVMGNHDPYSDNTRDTERVCCLGVSGTQSSRPALSDPALILSAVRPSPERPSCGRADSKMDRGRSEIS